MSAGYFYTLFECSLEDDDDDGGNRALGKCYLEGHARVEVFSRRRQLKKGHRRERKIAQNPPFLKIWALPHPKLLNCHVHRERGGEITAALLQSTISHLRGQTEPAFPARWPTEITLKPFLTDTHTRRTRNFFLATAIRVPRSQIPFPRIL